MISSYHPYRILVGHCAVILLTFLGQFSNVWGQEVAIVDSLAREIAKNQRDTNQVNCLNSLSEFYAEGFNYDKTLQYAVRASELASEIKYKKGIAVSNYYLGYAEMIKKDRYAAIESFGKALNLFKDLDNLEWQAKCHNIIGVAYKNLGNLQESLVHYFESIDLNERLSNKVELSRNYHNIGDLFYSNYKYSDAIKYLEIAEKIKEEINDETGVGRIQMMMGVAHHHLGNYKKAREYLESSLSIMINLNDQNGMSTAYAKLGWHWSHMHDTEKALFNLIKSKEICEIIGNKKTLSGIYLDLGNIYFKQKNYDLALEKYNASIKLANEIGDNWLVGTCYSNIAHSYFDRAIYNLALHYDSLALNIFNEIGAASSVARSKFSIANTYSMRGYYQMALNIYNDILEDQKKFDVKIDIIQTYNAISQVHMQLSNYSEAINNNLMAAKLAEDMRLKEGLASIYGNTARIYLHNSKYELSFEFCEKARKIYDEIGDKEGLSIVNHIKFEVYYAMGKYDEALECLNQALKWPLEKGLNNITANIYIGIAQIKIARALTSEALVYALKADSLWEEMKNISGSIVSKLVLGSLYKKIADYQSAKDYYEAAKKMSFEIGSKDHIADSYQALASIDSAMGNLDQSLSNYKIYILYRDSIHSELNKISLNEMEVKYETGKKENEIQRLEKEMEISDLQLKVHKESLNRINLEKEMIQRDNLFNLQQVDLLANEKKLKELELEKNMIEYEIQKGESEKQASQLVLLNKEAEIQRLEIKKQMMQKNTILAGLIGSLFLAFVIYNNYITRQKLKLQTIRNKIASDLHDEVGSTLSSIAIFSEIAKQQSNDVVPMLETIGESSRKMIDAMGDIVWTINPENDQFEKIILRMRSFAYQLLGAKQIDFEFYVDDNVASMKLPMEMRKNLYLIFKEATKLPS
jgi:tetratricopeptide (TPR) repeat protein